MCIVDVLIQTFIILWSKSCHVAILVLQLHCSNFDHCINKLMIVWHGSSLSFEIIFNILVLILYLKHFLLLLLSRSEISSCWARHRDWGERVSETGDCQRWTWMWWVTFDSRWKLLLDLVFVFTLLRVRCDFYGTALFGN